MFTRLPTGIPSLDSLLIPKDNLEGIAYYTDVGFFGVIFGAAGSGKSVLSLQLCCSFVQGGTLAEPHHAVYLTQESYQVVEDKIYEHFGFLKKSDQGRKFNICKESQLPSEWKNTGPSTLTIIRMPLDPQGQRAKLDYLLPMLKEKFSRNAGDKTEAANRGKLFTQQLLFCLDNAEAVDRDAFPKAVRKPIGLPKEENSKEADKNSELSKDELFFKRLREYCAMQRLNAWFSFEEERTQSIFTEELSIATTPEAYAADIVICLGIKVFDNGYRERSLEIVKAKNQSHRRGRHHFTIQSKDEEKPGGIVIFRSIATRLHIIGGRDKPDDQRRADPKPAVGIPCLLGIAEVDKEVHLEKFTEDEQARLRKLKNFKPEGYLHGGTVSVLVSDLDSIASEIALHFSLLNKGSTLYLTTLHRKAETERMIGQYTDLSGQYLQPGATQEDLLKHRLQIQDLFPEHISEDKLLHDIQKWIRRKPGRPVKRVVVDNVFRLSKKFPLIHDEGHFLAALFALFRNEGVAALVVDMVDVGEGTNPLHESFAAGLADHVFILRHAELRSEVSKVFSVAKLAGRHEPDKLWELRATSKRIIAEDRLAFYKGALSGRPEPVEVMLSLFAESKGSPVDKYLQTECEVLQATFGQRIKVHTCHPETYGALQQSVEARNLSALGDCHVISIDEIWLGELIRRNLLQDFAIEFIEQDDPDKNRWVHGEYVTAGQDIAIFRNLERIDQKIERLKRKKAEQHQAAITDLESKKKTIHAGNFAIPARVNVGIMMYNPNIFGKLLPKKTAKDSNDEAPGPAIPKFLKEFNQENASVPKKSLTWKQLADLQKQFIRHLNKCTPALATSTISPSIYRSWEDEEDEVCEDCKEHRKPRGKFEWVTGMPEAGIFTCSMETRETCVSFFLELLLSLIHKKDFLVNSIGELNWKIKAANGGNAWAKALSLMLQLLSPWDLVRLSHAWYRPARFERPCLFSRQWFTGWGMLGMMQPGSIPLELPKYDNKPELEAACVSGTWYLGILSGGTAYRAGAQIIKQLTSPDQELYKFNRGIGMPVRKSLYEDSTHDGLSLIDSRQKLLYARGMKKVAFLKGNKRKEQLPGDLQHNRCPFFRETIRYYRHVSPVFMGMMVQAAKIAVNSKWLWERKDMAEISPKLAATVVRAEKRYQEICKNQAKSDNPDTEQ